LTLLFKISLYFIGKTEPIIPTILVDTYFDADRDEYVAAPPIILVTVLEPVLVVSRAIVPKIVSILVIDLSLHVGIIKIISYTELR
jgi:hypothetical protein